LPRAAGRQPKKYQQHQSISLDHTFPIRHPGFHRVHPVAGVGLQAPTVAGSLATPDT
jgi:hypothetical protein